MCAQKCGNSFGDRRGGVFTGDGKQIFAVQNYWVLGAAQDGVDVLFNVVRLPLFNEQNSILSFTETQDFLINDRVGNVQYVERDLAVAIRI